MVNNKVERLKGKLVVYLPDTRGVEVSQYGYGNLKIGPGVFTYSREPGNPARGSVDVFGTCPGSTDECEAICYAKRVQGPVREVWRRNHLNEVPPIPADAKLLRLHVSGDFNSVAYINNWIARLTERPDVTMWVYTRSWRVAELLPALEALRALPNVQMFASMDKSCLELPPAGWRRSWIDGDERLLTVSTHNQIATAPVVNGRNLDAVPSYVCPEQTGRKENCETCGYCFDGQKNDVTFLQH